MRRRWIVCFLILAAGCKYPIIDLRDNFHPGAFGPNKVQPYGGVCIPQGPVTGSGLPSVPGVVVPGPGVPPPPIGGSVIPPPAPLPPPGGNPF